MPNSPPSLCSASTSSCSIPNSPKSAAEIDGQVDQEDSGFLSCWPMDEGQKVSMENFALIRVLGKGGDLINLPGFLKI